MIRVGPKKNRRRPVPKPRRALLRNMPRPRIPRGRAAVISGAVLLVCVIAGALGARGYGQGAWLTVSRIEVEGNRHWSAPRLLAGAGLEVGQRMHEVPFAAARKTLLALPGIEAASVRYLPGGRLRVTVREAEAVAAKRDARGRWLGLTPSGVWMPFAGAFPEDVPVLEGRGAPRAAERRAAAWLADVRAAHPDLFAGFSQLALRGAGGEAEVYWRDGRVRLRVDCNGEGSLGHLAGLMARERETWPEGATVDLRVEGYAYVH